MIAVTVLTAGIEIYIPSFSYFLYVDMTKQENFKLPVDLQSRFHAAVKKQNLNRSALLRSFVEEWVTSNSTQSVGG